MRATLDLIERTESQQFYQDLSDAFKEVRLAKQLPSLVNPTTDTQRKQRTQVLFFLNHYELVAVGCKNRVLDETFYSQFMRGAIVRDWEASKEFIESLRSTPAKLSIFEHFEELATRWQRDIEQEERLREELAKAHSSNEELRRRLDLLRTRRRAER
jgi:hypothetical protein